MTWTADLDAGLDGASVVIIQLRVGGQAARISDETFPLDCGCVGQETTGAGGLAKALRTVPVVLDVAERAAGCAAPGAWIVDFTNPVGIVTRALLDAGHRAVGLCNVAIGFQRRFAGMLGVAARRGRARPRRAQPPHLGAGGVRRRGRPAARSCSRPRWTNWPPRSGCRATVLATLGCVPSYYLRYFYCHDVVVAESRSGGHARPGVAEIEAELLEMYADPALTTKPELLSQRGGAFYSEAAVGLVASLLSGDGAPHAGERPQRRHLAVPARRGGHRGDLHGRRAAVRRRAATARRRAALSGLIAAVSAYEDTGRRRGACTAGGTGSTARCWPTRWSASTTTPRRSPTSCSPRTARSCEWAR